MEWLVTDQHGLFAMGTPQGTRTRKYHGFLCGIAGRLERNLLAHLDLSCHGHELWTHAYNSPDQPIYHPQGEKLLTNFESAPWPTWEWKIPQGTLHANLVALSSGGFEFTLAWNSSGDEKPAPLVIRPIWAMRALHALGGVRTKARVEGERVHFAGHTENDQAWITLNHSYEWRECDDWNRNFAYKEEAERGYDAQEDLHCCGQFEFNLKNGESIRLRLEAKSPHSPQHAFDQSFTPTRRKNLSPTTHALADFMLYNPDGVVAGFPWFGEWGRDTFIALPGMVAGLHEHDSKSVNWAVNVLTRWSAWINSDGMIPNLIAKEGPQWESADGTLWWTHALTSLWGLGVAKPELGLSALLKDKFARTLHNVIEAINGGRHLHLEPTSEGLLSVTSAHSTWMDARIDNVAATPRTGLLPEINALWFQARALHDLWLGRRSTDLKSLAARLLENPIEPERSNFVFLYSLPLAPVMFATLKKSIERDSSRLSKLFATPVGLRTLSPESTDYQACYSGGPVLRDRCYHQGPAWGWLKGHYDMARRRFDRYGVNVETTKAPTFSISSVPSHCAELFDAEPPFQWRGAPAQAWSSSCSAEAFVQDKWKMDDALMKTMHEEGGIL